MTKFAKIEDHIYFLVSLADCTHFNVRYGKITKRNTVNETEWLEVKTNSEPNRTYRLTSEHAYATLDEAQHKAISLIESNTLTAKAILESSVQLLKFN